MGRVGEMDGGDDVGEGEEGVDEGGEGGGGGEGVGGGEGYEVRKEGWR